MKNRYIPYNVNIKYEKKTYMHVGTDYGNRKIANKGIVRNLVRWVRKKRNREQKKYTICHTYGEWKKHVEELIPTEDSASRDDFIHWLMREKNNEEEYLEAIKIILIPMYIAILSMYEIFWTGSEAGKFFFMAITMFVVIIVATGLLTSAMDDVKFYEDVLRIVMDKDEEF